MRRTSLFGASAATFRSHSLDDSQSFAESMNAQMISSIINNHVVRDLASHAGEYETPYAEANMTRKALVIGINHYEHGSALYGCVDDAHAVKAVLETHGDGSINFDIKFMTASGPNELVPRSTLKDAIEDLFASDEDIALLYFAGHGHVETSGGYILASDSRRGDEGVALSEVITYANASRARNKVIVLDSCHSGIAGARPNGGRISDLAEGLTILTASTKDQYAHEQNDGGIFTGLFVDALSGGAANLVGDVTPGSVYAHVDQSLGRWGFEQRPIFKTNIKSFVSLRKVRPSIEIADLRQIAQLFPVRGYHFQLDPSYEPEIAGHTAEMPAPNPEHTKTFALLQKYNRVNLVVPVAAPHMWHAAMQSRACKLTVLGEHYRRLVEQKRI